MADDSPIQPATFTQVDSITHNGTVVAFGEEQTEERTKLWYRVLDLDQPADAELETSWEDATRWTRWFEVEWPEGLRSVGMSLFDVARTVDHRYAAIPGRWKAIDDGEYIYVFRALDLTSDPADRAPNQDAPNQDDAEARAPAGRVYANRFSLVRQPSPDAGDTRGTSGKEITLLQLAPVAEARYRRSALRESAFGETDSQGTRDLANSLFSEPTMEWSMLRPVDGAFTVTLTPSNVPGRMRWQFLCASQRENAAGEAEPAVAAYSFLRDDDGWADLDEKFDQLNSSAEDRFQIRPDSVFTITHPEHGNLALAGRPASVTFRLQEQNSPLGSSEHDDPEQGSAEEDSRAISGQRVMMAARTAVADAPQLAPQDAEDVVESPIVVVDFALGETGAITAASEASVADVDFGRSALSFNSADDRALLHADPQQGSAMAIGAWIKHSQGSGTIVSRGFDPGIDIGGYDDDAATPAGAASAIADGWAIEWRADRRQLVGIRVAGGRAYRVEAPAPGSFTWHNISLTHDAAGISLWIDGTQAGHQEIDTGVTGGGLDHDIVVGGPVPNRPSNRWVDFVIDQITLNSIAEPPSSLTMYNELDDAAKDALLGYWDFDTTTDQVTIRGADRVSQTAPLFPASKRDFELTIGEMSTGMGLVEVPDWGITSDPNLFLGSDGIVRVYVAARPSAEQEQAETVAGELVYDTTTTRARFGLRWVAESQRAEAVQDGELLLQAREAGPIMNRAVVEIEPDGDEHLRLTVSHPFRPDAVSEQWNRLPRLLEDFAAVINGRAPALRVDEDKRASDAPFAYDYSKGPKDTGEPYSSELVQAIIPDVPVNGADAVVEVGVATIRQLGNFTGWTSAALAVAGDFSGNVASTRIEDDVLEPLRIPGDFAVEAWINPDEVEGGGERRVINWRQSEDDGFSLSIKSQSRFALSDSDDASSLPLAVQDQWFSDRGGFEVGATFSLPDGGAAGGFRTLMAHHASWQAQITPAGFVERVDGLPGATPPALLAWRDSFENPTAALAFEVAQTVSIGLRGRSLVLKVEQSLPDGDLRPDLEPLQELIPREFDLVAVPVDVQQGDVIEASIVIDDSAAGTGGSVAQRPSATYAINGRVPTTVPADDAHLWLVPPADLDDARLLLGYDNSADTSNITRAFTGPIDSVFSRVGSNFTSRHTFDQNWLREDRGAREKFFNGTIDVLPTLGDRRFETVRGIAPAEWLHLATVCSDNFAVRFNGQGQRAVISDAASMTPDREFTIDCVVVREADKAGTILAKSIEIDAEKKLTLRLSLDATGRPLLEYTIDAEGSTSRYQHRGSHALQQDRPYHIVASVKLEELLYPIPDEDPDGEQPQTRWQLWIAHDAVWVYDITNSVWLGNEPHDLAVAIPDIGLVSLLLDALADLQRPLPENIARTLGRFFVIGSGNFALLDVNTLTNQLYDMRIQATDGPAVIGATTGEDPNKLAGTDMQWFAGLIGFVRMWRVALPASGVRALPLESGLPDGVPKPTAWWKLNENRGLQADDDAGSMHATLTDEEMWVTTRATARLRLYLNGRLRALRPVPIASREIPGLPPGLRGMSLGALTAATSIILGAGELQRLWSQAASIPYGDHDQFTIAGIASDEPGGPAVDGFRGLVDDVRVWNDIRTGEEILDLRHTHLGGNEDDLAAWWPLNAGIGTRIKDGSKRGASHLDLPAGIDEARFWNTDKTAPVGDDLPQVRHLLGGAQNDQTLTNVPVAPMAAEYGEVLTDAAGRIAGSQKRALVVGLGAGDDQSVGDRGESGWATPTGFKIGDIDLIYVGQAQSDPTLIGYIEGAPPIPSENLTRPYWKSPYSYDAYNDRTKLQLREAQNTVTKYAANYDTSFDVSIAGQLLLVLESKVQAGVGVAFGGFVDVEGEAAKLSAQVGPALSADLSLGTHRSFQASTGTHTTSGNTIGLAGNWEPAGSVKYPDLGRRLLPDNNGYALVKSGVANVYAMRLRRNGAMLGLTMQPDPDIPEDFNIITFKIKDRYTKQGSLDGKTGFVDDEHGADGSYFRPLEAANLEAQIEVYEAKLLASYESFRAGALGRRSVRAHFLQDDGLDDPKDFIDDKTVVPYDWDQNLNKRNIVNTYVWTAAGGLFAEETGTSVTRNESSGGSYSYKAMAGVKTNGKVALGPGVLAGLTWDASAMFGGHIQTSIIKTKEEGRNFDLDVTVDCDALLERYVGDPDQLYRGVPEPGKVSSYRFKSFYLVPDKSNFDDFWSRVVDEDWLAGNDLDAIALRQAKQNSNLVWRVLHRVTYVQRVPPSGTTVPAPSEPATKSVVHTVANWQNINLAIDVLRLGKTSTGEDISGLSLSEQLAAAADDLVRNQWPTLSPWWQQSVTRFDNDEPGEAADSVANLRRLTYEYLQAYADTGLLAANERLTNGPTPELPPGVDPPPEPEPELPPFDRLAEGAADALHLYTFDRVHLTADQKGMDSIEYRPPVRVAADELPEGLGGRLVLPSRRRTRATASATLAMSGDWGRVASRTYEFCFRLTERGQVLVASTDYDLAAKQQPFRWIAIGNERGDDTLAIWLPNAESSTSLSGVTIDSVDKLVYVAVGFEVPSETGGAATPAQEPMFKIAWASEDRPKVQRLEIAAAIGDVSGGELTLGGTGLDHFRHQFATGGFEMLHLAVHDHVFDAKQLARRLQSIGLG